jgi:acyl-CoA synthetase (NDP forming)
MGESSLDEAFQLSRQYEIPAYTFPEDAVGAIGVLWKRAKWIHRDETAGVDARMGEAIGEHARRDEARGELMAKGSSLTSPLQDASPLQITSHLLDSARSAGRTGLDAAEGRAVLEAYGIPTPPDRLAETADEAASFAREMGFPVALKLASPDILHKTDVGGVILGVASEDKVREGFAAILERARAHNPQARLRGVQVQKMVSGGREVIVGVKRDPTFGPLVMFGLGGVYVEALADVSFRLAPLTSYDAEEMIDEVRSARLLGALRGAPASDREALVDAIVRIGRLAADIPEISELDVNPLMVMPEGQGVWAVDARIILA